MCDGPEFVLLIVLLIWNEQIFLILFKYVCLSEYSLVECLWSCAGDGHVFSHFLFRRIGVDIPIVYSSNNISRLFTATK